MGENNVVQNKMSFKHVNCLPFWCLSVGICHGSALIQQKCSTHNHLGIKRHGSKRHHDFWRRSPYFPHSPNFIGLNIREMTRLSWRFPQLDDTINAFSPYLKSLLTARPFEGIFRSLIRSRHPAGVITSHCRSNCVPLRRKSRQRSGWVGVPRDPSRPQGKGRLRPSTFAKEQTEDLRLSLQNNIILGIVSTTMIRHIIAVRTDVHVSDMIFYLVLAEMNIF